MNPVELMMRRRQVRALVGRDPVDLVLMRAEKVSTPAGGYAWSEREPLAPQRVSLIPFRRRVSIFLVNSVAGDIPELPYTMVGEPDMDVERGDTFVYDGDEYEVIQIEPDRTIRTSCQVNYYGDSDG